MQTFENQYNFRVSNQIKVISALRSGPLSLNDLADKLNVSFTAISKIVDQLVEADIVKKVTKKTKNIKRGRIPTYVKRNTSVGVICAIDLGGKDLIVAICDLNNKILKKQIFSDVGLIIDKNLEEIAEAIREMLKAPEIDNRPLLGICISSPGMVKKDSGEFGVAYRVQSSKNSSPATYFFNEFNVPTHLYNDVKIAMVGERIFGCIPSDAKDYMFLHIGGACGVSFSFNGKLYQGKNGFCGELTTYKDEEREPFMYQNQLASIHQVAQYAQAIDPTLDIIPPMDARPDKVRIAKLFHEGNEAVVKAVEMNAKINARQIIAYNDMLDLEYIVIEGDILKYGEQYKEWLLKYINAYSVNPFRAKILFSSLEEPTSLLGAIYQASNIYYLNRLEEITNQRNPNGNYDISETFGRNI